MAPAEWDQIFNLFHAAREKSEGERVLLLDTACGENTLLRKAVEELLKEDEAASGFLSEPVFRSPQADPQATRIVPGQMFGRYITVALLGRGGMGEVWWARDTELDRPIALKFLRRETVSGLEADQITREARAASALNHPNIITIHEVLHAESTLAIVMELVEGDSLGQFRGKPRPVPEVLTIGLQVAEALAAAHARGIVHGDIKPENILLRPDQYVKVLDFGLARKITEKTIPGAESAALGTLRYMSPEQARGEALTPASDIFSFGLVLHELATGRHVFPATSPLETAHAILSKEPPRPSANSPIPARLDGLIRAMLAKKSEARPAADEVVWTLNELQAPETVSSALVPAVWKWLIAVAALIAICFTLWRSKQPQPKASPPSFREITTLVPENRATAAAISPNGMLAAYANVDGIFVLTIRNGETRALAMPSNYITDRLAWFADGTELVASGFSTLTNVPSIWVISVTAAAPRFLRSHARQATPSPDGTHVAFISQDWSQIWVLGSNGEQPRAIVAGPGGDTFPLVFWSPDGRRLAFQRRHYSKQDRVSGLDRYHERSYESVSLDTGRVVARVPNMWIESAAALPNGQVLFLRYERPGSRSPDHLWEVKTDPSTGAFVRPPSEIANPELPSETHISGLTATADGMRAMVLRQSDQNTVFVGNFDPSVPQIDNIRRLTLNDRTNYPHAWTADSRAVIFESNRSGSRDNFDLFKQDLNRRTPDVIVATPAVEVLPQLAPDGNSVLYASAAAGMHSATYKLMRVPVEGGTPEEVPIGGPLDEFRCALHSGAGCVLRTTVQGERYVFYDLDPIRGKGRELTRTGWTPAILGDWAISPDGTQVAIPIHDPREARIRVISLTPKRNEPQERDVVLEGLTDLTGVAWAADGRGWFASMDTTVGRRLLYVYGDGSFRSLGEIQGWVVPSPDGRQVAFLDCTIARNAWLIERH